jgi:hypothetical protein
MEISGSAFNAGLSTIQSGQRRVDQAAAEIASNNVSRPQSSPEPAAPTSENRQAEQAEQADLATSLVALQAGKQEVEAGAKVVKTADEVLGTLIDTRA